MSRPLLLALVALLALPALADAQQFGPTDRPGPPLTVPAKELEKALTCSKGVDDAKRAPVLLLQGTGATAKDNWSWTYEPALDKLGIPWCQADVPDHATQDVQRNGEFAVYAIRKMFQRAGRKIAVIGHSQGGMLPRWALRWWPDTRRMVDDVIGFAPSNHGTTQADCSSDSPCAPSGWQQSDDANFIKALNSGAETWRGISYTSIYTRTDEVVQPNQDAETGSSSLRTGDGRRTNVAIQDICPTAVSEHLLVGLTDPVAYALAVDALDHDGPADPKRVPLTTCVQVLHPGIDPVTGPLDGLAALQDYSAYEAKQVTKEPALACYTTVKGCSSGARSCTGRRVFTATFPLLKRASASLGGKRVAVTRKGRRLHVRVDLRRFTGLSIQLRVRGTDAKGRKVTYLRRYRPCA